MGLVRTSYEVYKDEGEIVLYCEHLHSVTYKNPENFINKFEKNDYSQRDDLGSLKRI